MKNENKEKLNKQFNVMLDFINELKLNKEITEYQRRVFIASLRKCRYDIFQSVR